MSQDDPQGKRERGKYVTMEIQIHTESRNICARSNFQKVCIFHGRMLSAFMTIIFNQTLSLIKSVVGILFKKTLNLEKL